MLIGVASTLPLSTPGLEVRVRVERLGAEPPSTRDQKMRLLALLAAAPPPPQSSQPYTVARALADLDGASWSLVLEDGAGVRVWRDAASTSGAVVLKAEVECPVPPAVLVDILLTRDYELIRRYNSGYDGGRDIEWRDGNRERISYVRTKPIWPLRARDFVVRCRYEEQPRGAVILNTPATHAEAPPYDGLVRGTLSGLHLVEPTDGGAGCRYTYTGSMDPAGAVPIAVVNWFAERRPAALMNAIRDVAVERHGS